MSISETNKVDIIGTKATRGLHRALQGGRDLAPVGHGAEASGKHRSPLRLPRWRPVVPEGRGGAVPHQGGHGAHVHLYVECHLRPGTGF
jgi:hypothetical protein